VTSVNCDRWTCKYYDDKKCYAAVVNLETQGDCDLTCLTFENFDPEVRKAQKAAENAQLEKDSAQLRADLKSLAEDL
jgi:hypothetical protein